MRTNKKDVEWADVNSLNILENSRIRVKSNDLSELMESVKKYGIMEPLAVRKEDNTVIFGNRRLAAAKKLGHIEVPVRWYNDISDEELYLMNLTENIQRKNINTIEIGRLCYGLQSGKLTGNKMTVGEIAVKLNLTDNRVGNCIKAFRRIPEVYQKYIKFFGQGGRRKYGDIPESLINELVNILSRSSRQLSDRDFTKIIEAVRDRKYQMSEVKVLGLLMMSGQTVDEALDVLDDYQIRSFKLLFEKKELAKTLKNEKVSSATQLIRKILIEYNKKLIF